jgi:hypothetical protein
VLGGGGGDNVPNWISAHPVRKVRNTTITTRDLITEKPTLTIRQPFAEVEVSVQIDEF